MASEKESTMYERKNTTMATSSLTLGLAMKIIFQAMYRVVSWQQGFEQTNERAEKPVAGC